MDFIDNTTPSAVIPKSLGATIKFFICSGLPIFVPENINGMGFAQPACPEGIISPRGVLDRAIPENRNLITELTDSVAICVISAESLPSFNKN